MALQLEIWDNLDIVLILTDISQNSYNLTGINTTEFILSTAHQKQDLIHK